MVSCSILVSTVVFRIRNRRFSCVISYEKKYFLFLKIVVNQLCMDCNDYFEEVKSSAIKQNFPNSNFFAVVYNFGCDDFLFGCENYSC